MREFQKRECVQSLTHTHTAHLSLQSVTSAMTCQLIPLQIPLCVSGYLEHVLRILHFQLKCYLLMRQILKSWNNELPEPKYGQMRI